MEFLPRKTLKREPVKDMMEYGTYFQKKGTWSDDSSMTFATMDSLINGYDIEDIGRKFCNWVYNKEYTPHGVVFDIGFTTRQSLKRINTGTSALYSGETEERSNGNGSLMRIIPLVFFLDKNNSDSFKIIEEVSGITHAHIRSKIACNIYIHVAKNLLSGSSPLAAYKEMKAPIIEHYSKKGLQEELGHFKRILEGDVYKLKESDINSSGYVIDTLEASLWCLLKNKTYENTVLKAVNLGEDTDTTAAVVGGLAGLYYGVDSIPKEWIDVLAKKDEIYELVEKLYKSLY